MSKRGDAVKLDLLLMFRTRQWAHETMGVGLEELTLLLWEDIADYYSQAGGFRSEPGDVWADLPPVLGINPARAMAMAN